MLRCRNAPLSETDRGELIAPFYADLDVTDLQALIDRRLWHQSNDAPTTAIEDFTAAIQLQPDIAVILEKRDRALPARERSD